MTNKPYIDHDEATLKSFRRDPAFAAEYLSAVIADGDAAEFRWALRRVVQALGSIPSIATKANLNRTSAYRTLSESGNPEFATVTSMLRAIDLQLAVVPSANVANPIFSSHYSFQPTECRGSGAKLVERVMIPRGKQASRIKCFATSTAQLASFSTREALQA